MADGTYCIQNSNVSHEWPLLAKNSFPSTSNRHRSSRWDSWLATLRYLRAVSSANGWLLISWLLAEPVLSILIFKWKSLSRAFLSFSPSLCVTVAGIDLYVQVKLYKAYQQVRTKLTFLIRFWDIKVRVWKCLNCSNPNSEHLSMLSTRTVCRLRFVTTGPSTFSTQPSQNQACYSLSLSLSLPLYLSLCLFLSLSLSEVRVE